MGNINLISLKDHIPDENNKYFLDTNVWLYLYCSVGNYNKQVIDSYNEFFGKILEANSKIYTTSMQISEFFNAYCRIEFNIMKSENSQIKDYKKDFRQTEEFIEVIKELNLVINHKIMRNSNKLDDDFNNTPLEDLLYTDKDYDFNDEYFLNLCEKNDLLMVSNDRDMLKTQRNVKVISNLN